MFLIQFLLPTSDNAGQPFAKSEFDRVRREITERFGGVTAYVRSPAVGLWADDSGSIRHDDVAIFEVMTEALDHRWWRDYRVRLEARFRQEEVVIRATSFERL
jgi:hypothetical protein